MFLSTSDLFVSLCLILCIVICKSARQSSDVKNRIIDNWVQEFVSGEESQESNHRSFVKREVELYHELILHDSMRRLEMLVDKIDVNQDDYVTQKELKDWIENKRNAYKQGNIDMQWQSYTTSSQEELSWEEYKRIVYGYMDYVSAEDREDATRMLQWDRRRWIVADTHGVDALSQEQFATFLYPEGVKHMTVLLEVEDLEEIDKNIDGRVSLDEYLRGTYMAEYKEKEPEWVAHKIEHFLTYLDEDADGFMDRTEVKGWIHSNADVPEVECKYLIFKADTDGDHKLSKVEIVSKYDLFVKSHVTEYGSALRWHDEL